MYKKLLTKIPIYLFSIIIVLVMFLPNMDVYGAADGYHDIGHDWSHSSHNSSSDCNKCTKVAGKLDCSTCGKTGKVACSCGTGGYTSTRYNNASGTILVNGVTTSCSYYFLDTGCTSCGGSGKRYRYYGTTSAGSTTLIHTKNESFVAGTNAKNCSNCGGDGATSTTCPGCNGQGWNYYCTRSDCQYHKNNKGWDHWKTESGYNSVCYTEANKYTVKYNKNGGEGSMDSTSHTYGTSKDLRANTFTKTGYTFKGWATSSDGSVKYDDEESVKNLTTTNNGTVTLYAVWKANSYTVTYNKNGGSGSMDNSTATYNSNFKTRENSFTKTGYTFNGWNEKADGSGTAWGLSSNGVYESGNSWKWTYTKNITLYAQWKANTYKVKYNANGGSGSMDNSSHTYDSEKALTANAFTKTGYTFQGWATSADGSKKYDNKEKVKNLATSGTKNLYAVWKANTYTITYNGNGATSGSMSASSHTYDSSSVLTTNAFKRTGYDFKGWSTDYNATTATYTNGQSVKNLKSAQGDNLILYAVWERTKKTVTYNTNGGTFSDGGTTSTKTIYVGDAVDLSLSPTKPGYTFVGWATSATSGYSLDAYTMPNSNATLYARYTIPISGLAEKAYFVVWNPSNTGKVVRAKEIKFNKETVNGYEYTLSGFNATTTALGSNVKGAFYIYDNAGNYVSKTFTSDTSSTPVKIPDVYKQTTVFKFYDIAAGEYSEIKLEENIVEGTSYKPLSLPKTLNGVTYSVPEGYYSTITFSSTTGNTSASTAYTVTKAETHTYVCQPKKYTLTLDANSGVLPGGSAKQNLSISYTDYFGNLPVPSREGHTFLGWYTAKSVTPGVTNGKQISSTDIYNTPNNTTLYAAWKVNSYDIIFDYSTNGGKASDGELFKTVSVEYGTSVTPKLLIGDGVKSGWTFVGWSKSSTSKTSDSAFTMGVPANNNNITLFAIYKRDYSYTFKDKTGDQIVSGTIFNNDTTLSLTAPSIRNFADWSAIGWSSSTTANEYYNIGQGVGFEVLDTSPVNATYYATYKKDISVNFVVPDDCNPIDNITKCLYYNTAGNSTKLTFSVPTPATRNNYSFVSWVCSNGNTYVYASRPSSGWSVSTSESLTFESTWNAKPTLSVSHHYYTLDDAKNGLITQNSLLTDIVAEDEEDGTITNISKLYVVGYNASEYTSLTTSATFSITYHVTDNFGHTLEKDALVYITDTATREDPLVYAPRFIDTKYLLTTNSSKDKNGDGLVDGKGSSSDYGGLAEKSVWKIDSMYNIALKNALADRSEKAAIAGMEYNFTKADIKAIKEYVKENGYSNFDDENGRNGFMSAFLR